MCAVMPSLVVILIKCACLSVCTHEYSAHGVQKRGLDALELELQVTVNPIMWVSGTKLRSFRRTANVLNHEAIFPALIG